MIEHKNIHEAIHAVYGMVGYVQKQSSQELRYTYASEAGFIQALRPAFIEHGITVSVTNMGAVQLDTYTTARGTVMFHAIIVGDMVFTHAPTGTSILVKALGEGSDAGDKAVNKAMTDMYKYALRQTFMIETGDDPDEHASEERSAVKEVAKELGAKVTTTKAEMTLEEAGAILAEDGTPYGKLPIGELTVRFNGMQKIKKTDKFTPEHAKKMAAIKLLIAEKSRAVEAQEELYGNQE
jgi:hypothetical protein